MSDDEEAVLSRLFVETQAATIAELSPTRKPKKQAKRTKAKGKKGSLKELNAEPINNRLVVGLLGLLAVALFLTWRARLPTGMLGNLFTSHPPPSAPPPPLPPRIAIAVTTSATAAAALTAAALATVTSSARLRCSRHPLLRRRPHRRRRHLHLRAHLRRTRPQLSAVAVCSTRECATP